jgi:N-acyl-D-amino-acid deacylase
MDEADMQRVLRDPWTMIGSDASVCVEPESSASKPHPRAYGTFPRVLGKYVRQEKVLELEEAVRKMTSLPAGFFKLPSRGRIAPGYVADITVFSPATIIDRATYIEPNQYPGGISHVFVAGTPVVLDGEHTEKKPGRVLRS